MLKYNIQYEDFDGDTVQETLYFNLSLAEAARMQSDGTFDALTKAIDADPTGQSNMLSVLEKFIALSYGTRADNGKGFHKDEQQSADFLSSLAYDALFRKFIAGGESGMVDFITGILPNEIRQQLAAQMAGGNVGTGVKITMPTMPTAAPATSQGIQVNSIKLPDPPAEEAKSTVPPAFQNKMAERARRHGLRPQPAEEVQDTPPAAPAQPEAPEETSKPISEMTDAELEAELAKRKSN